MEYTPIPIEFTSGELLTLGLVFCLVVVLPLAILTLAAYGIRRSLRRGGLRGLGQDSVHLVGGILKIAVMIITVPLIVFARVMEERDKTAENVGEDEPDEEDTPETAGPLRVNSTGEQLDPIPGHSWPLW